ncbi:molybdopterin-binding oxidoreductase [Acidovorax sp. Root217]|uniref:molybdopterin-binding oxidoreductase n=1 Tax=Acidovorax sp. Root217 TaxID=1736492 RepID=UPI00070B424E|nr:molybdopterin-binding oxidoreductase [Acidovorax sp. Root217]KRC27831.1 molybdopterin-binding oxidoreductase [Acidovorax sp. Root217]
MPFRKTTSPRRILSASLATAMLLALAACGGSDDSPSVRVQGAVDRPGNYDAAALQRQAAVTQSVTFSSGSGSQSRTYTGATLWSVLNDAGTILDATKKNDGLNRYVVATGSDGYRVAFGLGEINPEFGNKASVLAYAETQNGSSGPLASADGPFRVTAPGDVKGGRYVSNLVRLEVRPSGSTAAGTGGGVSNSFAVSGAVTQPASFDLATLQTLPASTVTVAGTTYTGVNLWTLLSSTTGLKTDATAKNPTLAMVAVATGSDGYKALVSLGEIDPGFGNKAALVAYAINGEGLGANGVARLIVPGEVKQGRSVSNLVSIEVITAAP